MKTDHSSLDLAILEVVAAGPRSLDQILAVDAVRKIAFQLARRRAGASPSESADETVKERLQALRRAGQIEFDRATHRWAKVQGPSTHMTPANYPVVGTFKNETPAEMSLYLEMIPEEVILGPGDEVELLARPTEGLLPLDIQQVEDGYHIHAHKVWDPDWHVRYRGKIIEAQTPTRLSDFR